MSRVVVITGATKGIGRAMAEGFLARGAKVALCARSEGAVAEAVRELAARYGAGMVVGRACDVTNEEDLVALDALARATFGAVDVWINNAGTSTAQVDFLSLAAGEVRAVVDTNLVGTMLGSHVALRAMKKAGKGALYNMEGFGSDGATQPGMATYGASKVAVRYFTRALARELRGTPILVCTLSPGVVVTDLLVQVYRDGDAENHRRAKRLFQFIADRAEDVGPWLADRVLANTRSDVRIAWMTIPKAIVRFFIPRYHTRAIFPERP